MSALIPQPSHVEPVTRVAPKLSALDLCALAQTTVGAVRFHAEQAYLYRDEEQAAKTEAHLDDLARQLTLAIKALQEAGIQ